ncbi:hypothetical protein IAD21_04348 [Abditibacteriota bacterium]|nr:hypothetical protein IAD21_04348 [Abditibacteriota bacterium]
MKASSLMFQISTNNRFLTYADGSSFFWLGDTAWTALQRLDPAEALEYLDNRASKGFNIAQVVGLMEFDGLREPNRKGDLPLLDLNPTRPNPAYWNYVRWFADEAFKRGIYLALLPTWGDKWNASWGIGPQIFDADNAKVFGRWLGERFKDIPLFWVLGGDRPIQNDEQLAIIRALASGLKAGDDGAHPMTFHPPGGTSSSKWLHNEPWLDFNMQQSGHTRPEVSTAPLIEADYALTPTKPVIDGEPRYEDHPIAWNWDYPNQWDASNGYFDALDVRRATYMALFSGACGHTYGANSVFQTYRQGQDDRFGARRDWREALDLPGAGQLQHAKNLLESRAFFSRIPAQDILRGERGEGSDQLRATRDEHGSFALVYVPSHRSFALDVSTLNGPAHTSWFNPRSGESHPFGKIQNTGVHSFESPQNGPDWILTLDTQISN